MNHEALVVHYYGGGCHNLQGRQKLTTGNTCTQVQCRCINLYISNFPLYSEGARPGAAFLCTRKSTFSSTGIRFKKVVLENIQPVLKLFLLSVFWFFAALYRQPLTYHKQNKKPDSLQRYLEAGGCHNLQGEYHYSTADTCILY